jgi:hypothetical protein
MNKKLDDFRKKDYCVLCKKETPYHLETHIKDRYYYIECVGQLCSKCFSFYYSPQSQWGLSFSEILIWISNFKKTC